MGSPSPEFHLARVRRSTEERRTARARLSISHTYPFPRWILLREAGLGGRLQQLLLRGVESGFASALLRLQVVEVVEEPDGLERVQRRVVLLSHVAAQQGSDQVILGEDAPRFVLRVPHPPQPGEIHERREILPFLQSEPLDILGDVLSHEHRVGRQGRADVLQSLLEGHAVCAENILGDAREGREVRVHLLSLRGFHVHVQQASLELVDQRNLRHVPGVVLVPRGHALDVDGEIRRDVVLLLLPLLLLLLLLLGRGHLAWRRFPETNS
mmetsp:Transcript_8502/g.38657  ORF Transcript_8502/g.38657 Transcript_8502/m.38657 type:complete len:269 (-) Transcript_8502:171-977(-)